MTRTLSAPFKKRLLIGFMACIALGGAGCSFFGGDDGDTPAEGEVCADAFNRYVTQHPNGLGVTSTQCAASERGEWIDGRCYCHGRE